MLGEDRQIEKRPSAPESNPMLNSVSDFSQLNDGASGLASGLGSATNSRA